MNIHLKKFKIKTIEDLWKENMAQERKFVKTFMRQFLPKLPKKSKKPKVQ